METHEEYQRRLYYLMGLKLNKFVNPKSQQEYNKIMALGKDWFDKYPNEPVNIY